MGYLYYGYYALYYEQGRAEAIRQLGFTYKELEEVGVLMPVVAMNARYLRPAFYDDLITVTTSLESLDKESSQITFVSRLYNAAGKLLNEGSVSLVFIATENKKKIPIPELLYNRLLPFFTS